MGNMDIFTRSLKETYENDIYILEKEKSQHENRIKQIDIEIERSSRYLKELEDVR